MKNNYNFLLNKENKSKDSLKQKKYCRDQELKTLKRNNWLKQHGIAMKRKKPIKKKQQRKRNFYCDLAVMDEFPPLPDSYIELYKVIRKIRKKPLIVTHTLKDILNKEEI